MGTFLYALQTTADMRQLKFEPIITPIGRTQIIVGLNLAKLQKTVKTNLHYSRESICWNEKWNKLKSKLLNDSDS
ncbi:MAG: hypothetical protein CVU52_02905 [Deltaproteobacteria bacterium HGW-Deltaproteobacteria-10]|nr:MAG: hypothetical protein CVU52_02905 [Deltaproteobacteria bacterium HGW-Deltaproteobacteria-10]